MAQSTVLTKLAEFLSGLRYEDLSADVVEMARTRVLDGLAVSIAGRELPWSVAAWEAVRRNRGVCTVIGRSETVPAVDAVMANGVIGHSILQEDIGPGAHPSTVVVPTALAVGEEIGASGRQITTAIVVGYEAVGRIEQGLTQHAARSGFRILPLLAPFAAAAATAHLWGLSAAQTANALGFSANLASGLYQGFAEGTMEAYFHAGIGARNGVTAATIARVGAMASPWTFEGAHGFFRTFTGTTERASAVIDGLGKHFAILRTYRKAYPTSHSNQLAVDFARQLRGQVGEPRHIRHVVLAIPAQKEATPGRNGHPPLHNMLQAQMNVRFCCAAALLGRPVESFTYFRDHYNDEEVWDLVRRTHLSGQEGRQGTRLEVHLDDGRTLVSETVWEFPATREALREKFVGMTADFLGEAQVQNVADLILRLDDIADVRQLTACLAAAA